jgi:hypothetical protein
MIGKRWILAAVALLPAVFVGCNGRPSPVGVAGTVLLDGKPLSKGSILFEPVSESKGQSRSATITDGKFQLPEIEGVPPGMEFKVIIKAFKKTGRKYPNADMSLSYDEEVQYLPEQYNSKSTLRVTISDDEEKNKFDFELTSLQ